MSETSVIKTVTMEAFLNIMLYSAIQIPGLDKTKALWTTKANIRQWLNRGVRWQEQMLLRSVAKTRNLQKEINSG